MHSNLKQLLVLCWLLLTGCAAKPIHNNEVDIGECKIFIPYNLKQYTHESKYDYYFAVKITPKNFYEELRNISIHPIKNISPEKFIKKMEKKNSPYKLLKKFKDGNYTIIQFHFDGLENDFNYRVYMNKIMIQFINIPFKDVKSVLEYCRKTKK